ncbi:MAG: Amidohydrolase family protein, partial [Chthonomonadales bacterium]|nr:Amidohydrolase family protein [Chthonomonadales bacterium]
SLSVLYIAVSAGGIKLESTHPPVDQQAGPITLKLESNARVLKGMTILDGLGGRIEHGLVVIRGDRIVYVGDAERTLPEGAPVTDLSGLFLMPGLIDSHVHIGASAGGSTSAVEYRPSRIVHDLQAYLGQGVTSVVSMTDNVNDMLSLRKDVTDGNMRAPRTYLCGLGITAPGGVPTKYFIGVPGVSGLMTSEVGTPQKAQAAVQQLADLRVDFIKLYLDGGGYKEPAPVMADAVFRKAVETAKAKGLLTTVQVDNDLHARFAIEKGVRGIELAPPDLSDQTIVEMVTKGVTLTPALAASEGLARTLRGEPITDPAALQWVDPAILASLRSPDSWLAPLRADPAAVAYYTQHEKQAFDATRRAVASGVTILAGSDAGNPGSFHGPGLIRELELLVDQAKMTPGAALVSATGAAARRLGSTEVGQIAPGAYADLIVLGADPTKNIRAVRNIRTIYFGGLPLQRNTLLSTPPGRWTPESAGVQVEKR